MGLLERLRGALKTRAQPKQTTIGLAGFDNSYEILCGGYVSFADTPEVRTCVDTISDLVSNMTIHLMENTENGDMRVKDGLSRKIDIEPCTGMTKKNWLYNVVHTMLLEGNGNAFVLPILHKKDGKRYIANLKPLEPYKTSVIPYPDGTYKLNYGGRIYDPRDVLHFALSPDPQYPYMGRGYRVILSDVVKNLKSASNTKTAFFTDKWRPSVIITVNGMTQELADEGGRDDILNRYINETKDGAKPWVIPGELFKVDQVRPLSLSDLAINEAVSVDKRTVAAIFGIPPFFVGAGDFDRSEYNNFVQTKILSVANIIQQELTAKLLTDPNRYFKLNAMSLYSYSLDTLANMGMNLYTRGIATGNEVRNLLGMSPRDGLDELTILENYIPQAMIGDQKKLTGGDYDETN